MILAGVFAKGLYPLLIGQEIILQTRPKDPRDLFRGQYVSLNYAFNSLQGDSSNIHLQEGKHYSFGDVVYLKMKKNDRGVHEFFDLYEDKPEEGIFLKGHIQSQHYTHKENSYSFLSVKCGIEEFFTNPEKALEIENAEWQLEETEGETLRRQNVKVAVMVAPDGKARIKEVLYDDLLKKRKN